MRGEEDMRAEEAAQQAIEHKRSTKGCLPQLLIIHAFRLPDDKLH